MFQHESHFRRDPRGHHRGPYGPRDLPFGFGAVLGRERWGRGPIRRGDIRPLILAALATKPMHGYEVIQELEARSGGRWRPSAGSVYPTLQQLADEGLVTSNEVDGRRTYTLTDEGRRVAAASPAPSPWADDPADAETSPRRLGALLMVAVVQVEQVGSPRARQETARVLRDARRQVYRLLADDGAIMGDEDPATQF